MTTVRTINQGDTVPGVLLSVHLFLTVASMVIGKAARDAIFLSRFTPLQMTAVDLATLVAIAAMVAVQLRMQARISTKLVLLVTPLLFALGDLGLWVGLSTSHVGWIPWVVYLWIGVQAAFGTPHASVLAIHVLTVRQSRRLCGMVGGGAILGWIGGGLVTTTLAAHFGASSLLLGASAVTALCPMAVWRAWGTGASRAADTGARGRVGTSGSLARSASLVWASPHLRAIAVLAFVSSAVTTIAGLQFRAIASQSIGSTDDLAAFFGSFSLYAGLIALATQVLLTSRILRGLGLGVALAIAPVALAAGSVGVLLSGTLTAALLLKGSDQVLRYSVDRAAVELLYRPLSQRQIFEGKTFIDALVCRLGDAAGAIIALFGVAVLHLSFSWLSVMSIAVVAVWLVSAEIARRRYRASLLDHLRLQPRSSGAAEESQTIRLEPGDTERRAPDWGKVLDPAPTTRLHVLRELTRARVRRPGEPQRDTLLSTALAMEIVGFAILVETSPGRNASSASHRQACRESIERISRLLSLLHPDRYPSCLRSALASGSTAREGAALEYLDTTLASPHRQILIPLLERWTVAAA